MSLKSAIILSGCGHLDGSEIRETVLVMLELDKHGIEFKCFAPNANQKQVINHVNKENSSDTRNILVESARISRGEVYNISDIKTDEFDMLIIPGGYGVAKNFSNLFDNDGVVKVISCIQDTILNFYNAKKLIGAVCIAPAIVTVALKDLAKIKVTIGDDKDNLIEKLGGMHIYCDTDKSVTDKNNRIFSCSAYMRNDSLYKIYLGIQNMINSMVNF
ncbi:isoprenoid biosynthesis glyoxalase ElbB [Neoehrlichia mikurensis]|uniref:Isoprenoid biosynthesis glyoxalase ElbB n=1 Tax=Neoehrlichia mikurensis TaxID=89586 RepID=A0A9Q9BU71_9RICK|nr:isoprenoid biosynthesis glyoxalase ElbB [Neoehrlichia mikurensis]QXK92334.1 isoprenoid biosynthesis glyoxalase ElbB [Neoehrlichia mikurensis]QXK92788.1 isoprenoid biosynthesis glyoxalase ElbB [Neoehrlichia mikurensis]QXK94029.1 isoprenoid biosynthesis glyoxalase ElbB [Neoehrlichia mikurensis]UTO55807.1 isoprenoid biosynthesis glyoxalase ElbB [Neoehrlichia mikurensis]UTO56721.1 isoprenoid biosynthesis glyoxalase ElbB [Neoehrlichia mikurensis]